MHIAYLLSPKKCQIPPIFAKFIHFLLSQNERFWLNLRLLIPPVFWPLEELDGEGEDWSSVLVCGVWLMWTEGWGKKSEFFCLHKWIAPIPQTQRMKLLTQPMPRQAMLNCSSNACLSRRWVRIAFRYCPRSIVKSVAPVSPRDIMSCNNYLSIRGCLRLPLFLFYH